jgi:hypothetical protein
MGRYGKAPPVRDKGPRFLPVPGGEPPKPEGQGQPNQHKGKDAAKNPAHRIVFIPRYTYPTISANRESYFIGKRRFTTKSNRKIYREVEEVE